MLSLTRALLIVVPAFMLLLISPTGIAAETITLEFTTTGAGSSQYFVAVWLTQGSTYNSTLGYYGSLSSGYYPEMTHHYPLIKATKKAYKPNGSDARMGGTQSGSPDTYTWSNIDISSLPNGTYTVNFECKNHSGAHPYASFSFNKNGSYFARTAQSASPFTNVYLTYSNGGAPPTDTTPPTVPMNVTATAASSSSIALSWTASTDAVGVVGYNVYRGTTLVGSPTTTSFTNTGLTPSTAYTYTVKARDAAGNISAASAAATATTLPNITDTTPPTVPSGVSAVASSINSITVSWTASTDAVGVTGYIVYRGSTQIGTPSSTSFTDTGLSPSTTYSYTVKAKDAANNTSAASSAASATTLADTSPPSAPSGFGTPLATNVSVKLTWSASIDNVGISQYTIYRDGTLVGSSTTPSFTNNGLTPSTLYTYTVKAVDAAGNVSAASSPITVTTLAVADTTAPSAPTGVTANTISSSSIAITWTAATDNVAVANYDIYRNGTKIGSSTSSSYTDAGLSASTSYTYTVKAVDAAGNVSVASATTPSSSATTPSSGGTPTSSGEDSGGGSCGFGSGIAGLTAMLSLMLVIRLRQNYTITREH